VTDRDVAAAARDAYISLVQTVAEERSRDGLDANVSIKLSMMGQKIDEDYCLDSLRSLLQTARERDVFIRLDMEGSDITEPTLRVLEAAAPDFPVQRGIVRQAYVSS